MRLMMLFLPILMIFDLGALKALPQQCPKLTNEILLSNKSEFPMVQGAGKEIILEGYEWKILDAQNLDKSLPNPKEGYPFVFSAARTGVTMHAKYTPSTTKLVCTYDFKLKDQVIAQLTLQTDDSQQRHVERWEHTTKDAAKALQIEEEQEDKQQPHFRIRAE